MTEQTEAEDTGRRRLSVVRRRRSALCLRRARQQLRLSLQAVETMSAQEFKASVLGAYERGERSISVPRLQRLALLYDVPVDLLLPAPERKASDRGRRRRARGGARWTSRRRSTRSPGPSASCSGGSSG